MCLYSKIQTSAIFRVLMAYAPYFTAVSLKITSIKQKELVGNN